MNVNQLLIAAILILTGYTFWRNRLPYCKYPLNIHLAKNQTNLKDLLSLQSHWKYLSCLYCGLIQLRHLVKLCKDSEEQNNNLLIEKNMELEKGHKFTVKIYCKYWLYGSLYENKKYKNECSPLSCNTPKVIPEHDKVHTHILNDREESGAWKGHQYTQQL